MAIKSIQFNNNILDISYEIINPNSKINLIILHGWGSNKNLMKGVFSPFMKRFRHIYIDLPGFGNSLCNLTLRTKDYAKIIDSFLKEINSSKDIVMGHSFGGKIALLLEPKILILIGSAGIYIDKSFKIKLKISIFKFLKLFGLAKFRSLFIASDAKELSEPMYKTFKNVVDEDYSDKFTSFSGNALLFWGKDDTATPLSSGKKIDSLIKNSTLKVYDGDHYFFMKKSNEISQYIEKKYLQLTESV